MQKAQSKNCVSFLRRAGRVSMLFSRRVHRVLIRTQRDRNRVRRTDGTNETHVLLLLYHNDVEQAVQ